MNLGKKKSCLYSYKFNKLKSWHFFHLWNAIEATQINGIKTYGCHSSTASLSCKFIWIHCRNSIEGSAWLANTRNLMRFQNSISMCLTAGNGYSKSKWLLSVWNRCPKGKELVGFCAPARIFIHNLLAVAAKTLKEYVEIYSLKCL